MEISRFSFHSSPRPTAVMDMPAFFASIESSSHFGSSSHVWPSVKSSILLTILAEAPFLISSIAFFIASDICVPPLGMMLSILFLISALFVGAWFARSASTSSSKITTDILSFSPRLSTTLFTASLRFSIFLPSIEPLLSRRRQRLKGIPLLAPA